MDDRLFLHYLFIAVPSLRADVNLMKLLKKAGLVEQADIDAAQKINQTLKKYGKIGEALKGQSLIDRLLTVAPEILSVSSVDLLRKFNLIDSSQAHKLRLAVRAGKAAMGGTLPKDATIIARINAVLGKVASNEAINLIRSLDDARIDSVRAEFLRLTGRQILTSKDAAAIRQMTEESLRNAQKLRAGLGAFQILKDAVEHGRSADSILKALYLIGPELMTPALIDQMRKLGLISGRTASVLKSAMALGKTAWRNFAKAAQTENLAARILLVSQGVITHEMLNFLRDTGIITPRQAAIMRPMVSVMRTYTKGKIDEMLDTGRRYRVLPGESPIQTFARGTRKTDQQILKEIAKAAQAAGKEAEALLAEGGRGNRTRANQLRITRKALHDVMRELWENHGMLTIFGEAEAARLAQVSMAELEDRLWRKYGKAGDAYRRSLELQARAGVDSYISRHENLIQLSRRVYNNLDLAMGRVEQIINRGLLQGKSAREIASMVEQFINPRTPGGVRYAAMRLARTEINNAFHYTSIRYTREMPWVLGYQWHLSGSHPKPDICNQYADKDHDNMGTGVFKKRNVPSKPHPHCFCYITPVTVPPERFAAGMRAGRYDSYLSGFTG